MIGDDEDNFSHKLLLAKFQIFKKSFFQIIYQQISNYQKLNYLR